MGVYAALKESELRICDGYMKYELILTSLRIKHITMKYFYFWILLIVLVSCDGQTNINYEITNETSEPIDLIVEHLYDKKDTLRISPYETVIFYEFHDFGPTTIGTMNDLDSIRVVKDLKIISDSGKTNKNDLTVLDEWELDIPRSGFGGLGRVMKDVKDDDLH